MKDQVTEYAKAVVSGKILAPKKVIWACNRHLKDLEKSKNDKKFPYYWDIRESEKVIAFISSLKNPDNGKQMKLVNFQAFAVGSVFGWLRKSDSHRKFKKMFISMARKNGKTILVAGIALYILLYQKYPVRGKQIYCAANKRDQAKVAFNYINNFLVPLRSDSPFVKRKTQMKRDEITDAKTGSFIKPLSNDKNGIQGLNTTLAIFDEQADSNDITVYDAVEKSSRMQKDPLMLLISTVSPNINGWFHEMIYQYVEQMVKGDVVDDETMVLWYEQESEDEIADTANWIKSNPILYDKDIRETLLPTLIQDWKTAQAMGRETKAKIYNFNMWQQANENSYIKVQDWANIKVDKTPDLYGREVYIGMDLARTGDLSAVSWIVPLPEQKKFWVDSHAFVGTRGGIKNKIQKDKIDYLALRRRGEVTLSNLESGNIDDQQIIDFIYNLIGEHKFSVNCICYDRYSANHIIDTFNEDGYTMVDVAQGFATLSEPTKQFRKYVQDGGVIHGDNRLLEIAVNNAIVKEINDAVLLDKTMYRNKIDPLAALLDAMTQAYNYDFSRDFERDSEFYEKQFHF